MLLLIKFVNKHMLGSENPKAPDILKAQVATFATEHLDNLQDREYVFRNISNLAIGVVADVSRITDAPEFREQDGRSVRIPKGSTVTVATVGEYGDFLRSVGGSSNERIQGRADILRSYEKFAPTVDLLRSSLEQKASSSERPNWRLADGNLASRIGDGADSKVWGVEIDGVSYVVRMPNGANTPHVTDEHLAGAVLGKGIPHLEQIVAASYEEDVTIAERIPGRCIPDLLVDDANDISDDQVGELVDTFIAANGRRINFDFSPSNFLYDSESGFGIVDYTASIGRGYKGRSVGNVIGSAVTLISKIGSARKAGSGTTEYSVNGRSLSSLKATLMGQYRDQVAEKLEGSGREEALAIINARTQAAR
jgi:hypothetical protein